MNVSRLLPAHPAQLSLLLPSCAHIKAQRAARAEAAKKAAEPPKPTLFAWEGPAIQGKPKVIIDLGEQKARIYDRGQEVAWTYVATGVEGRRTPSGSFSITEKIADKHSNKWGVIENADGDVVNWDGQNGVSRIPPGGKFVGASMPHWMRLTGGGVGMHGGPIPEPGSPASHGCIRLPYEMAERMFSELPVGTPVLIQQ